MKTLAMLSLLAAMGLMGGCSIADAPGTPAQQRFERIGLATEENWEQVGEDTDSVLLLRPASHMSIWNVYHRD